MEERKKERKKKNKLVTLHEVEQVVTFSGVLLKVVFAEGNSCRVEDPCEFSCEVCASGEDRGGGGSKSVWREGIVD